MVQSTFAYLYGNLKILLSIQVIISVIFRKIKRKIISFYKNFENFSKIYINNLYFKTFLAKITLKNHFWSKDNTILNI